jgi:hypothetical protein
MQVVKELYGTFRGQKLYYSIFAKCHLVLGKSAAHVQGPSSDLFFPVPRFFSAELLSTPLKSGLTIKIINDYF